MSCSATDPERCACSECQDARLPPLSPCKLCGGERDQSRFAQCARCRRDDDQLGEER